MKLQQAFHKPRLQTHVRVHIVVVVSQSVKIIWTKGLLHRTTSWSLGGKAYVQYSNKHRHSRPTNSHCLEFRHGCSHCGADVDLLGGSRPQVFVNDADEQRMLLVELGHLLRADVGFIHVCRRVDWKLSRFLFAVLFSISLFLCFCLFFFSLPICFSFCLLLVDQSTPSI